ncbi:ribosome bioproteinsis protein ytm1 [Purpureocillium takamizusanense]|uniref:Ribosome biogenesis protein YTM1 n=1 Tax=Purpureocillium takamizusanense TaxID=2060973 RepID=A0A9Q8QHC2_9HYPO|nr:ribosome biogenesis protein ytm1 [Purpureocillium takamizusanense]UNI18899.1 ribosome bioproteinsis protein ytm1 [Purpureocillium takamizusanense]
MDSSPTQVKVIFTTSEPDLQLPESKQQLLVPADIKRYGLSRILNSESMLDTSSPVPLDFLANGTFLRTSIDEYLTANGLSSETTLTLQYVRSLLPPVYEASFQHDDWVSGVDVLSATSPAGSLADAANVNERLASASYDGLVRIWNPSGETVATSSSGRAGGHTQRANAVRWLSPTQLASAGLDRKVVVWDYSEADDGFTGSLKPSMELFGHEKSINGIDVNGSTGRILTASSDGRVGVWTSSKRAAPQADPDSLPSAHSSKRAKLSAAAGSTAQRGPLAMIPMHNEAVTAAIFHPNDATVAYSASQDHTVRTIDLTTQKEVSRLTTMHPIMCAAALPTNSLIAAGTSARHITLLDPRESAAATAAMTLRGHVNMVVSLSPSPENDYSLVSGSHDSTCRVWDLRSVRPGGLEEGGGRVSEAAYTIGREWLQGKKLPAAGDGAKVLSVVWDKTWGIVSGGEDKKVQINRGRGLLSS